MVSQLKTVCTSLPAPHSLSYCFLFHVCQLFSSHQPACIRSSIHFSSLSFKISGLDVAPFHDLSFSRCRGIFQVSLQLSRSSLYYLYIGFQHTKGNPDTCSPPTTEKGNRKVLIISHFLSFSLTALPLLSMSTCPSLKKKKWKCAV